MPKNKSRWKMASEMEIMQLCRLCLVKEQVNVPIFDDQGDIRQIFLKITACLPIKVSKEDKLPKKICDGCLYKLELLYQFWNTTTNAEKQLLSWLSAAGMDANTKTTGDAMAVVTQTQVTMKEEPNTDVSDDHCSDSQPSPEGEEFSYHEESSSEGNVKAGGSNVVAVDSDSEPAAKRPRKTKPPADMVESDNDVDYQVDEAIAKTEDESADELDVPAFVSVSTEHDGEQAGPSGLGSEAPFEEVVIEIENDSPIGASYQCEVCSQIFPDKKEFLEHHMSQFGPTFTCCHCDESFKNSTELYQHYESHKLESGIILRSNDSYSDDESVKDETVQLHYGENVQSLMNIPDTNTINSTNELLYILDDENQCINEVVIEEDEQWKPTAQYMSKPENFTIVQVDHGYIIPSVFKGQLEAKRRYKKREASLSELTEDEDTQATNHLVKMEPSTSKIVYSPPKQKLQQPKRRHEVPDFSTTSYQILAPTEDVDMPHYKCLRCEQLFINKFVFFRHIEKGKCYINSCDVCTSRFSKNSEFYEHYMTEHTERAICNFCFRTFMYEKNVKEHMLRHLDQFRHRCEECNKGFYTVREYRNHYKNRHMGIRHKCDECGRSFADEYYFKRHIATHTIKVTQTF